MANPEHLELLKQGVTRWNKWRAVRHGLRPDLDGADLDLSADLSEVDLSRANLWRADLRNVDLRAADLTKANLGRANLSQADLRWSKLDGADLSGADLSGADLSGADLGGVNLGGVNLSEANLRGARLGGADLSSARLGEADLIGTYLRRVNLSDANLSRADLSGTDLSRADLWGADFSESHAIATTFADVDLSAVKGLEAVVHAGPSVVGIDTIYKSRGKIPEVFLRGCGIPDGFIAYIGSMVGRPFEYYSCFISYSTHDQEFAERLHADLQAKGVRCWFAPHDIQGGRKIHEQIDEAIRLHDKLLLILSEDSMNSEWVKTEIAKARRREVKEVSGCCSLSGWSLLRCSGIGSASTAIRAKTQRARCGSISFPTSASGKNMIRIRRRCSGWWKT